MTNHAIVHLTDVKIYQGESLVLDKVNLNITKGEFVYLIGKTGSGKSSLLKTLYAALPLAHGKGTVAGFDLKALNRRTIPLLRRKIGIVFQDFNLLDDRTVEENLRFALRAMGWKDKSKMLERINELLERVDLKGKNTKMPHAISGGEQQRVVFARALLNHPELIIADEPTGNLDTQRGREIMELLAALNRERGITVLMVTHEPDMAAYARRVVRFVDGLIDSDRVQAPVTAAPARPEAA